MAKRYTDTPIPVMDTAGMTDEEFSQARVDMGGIGGSDMGAICGVSTWTSPQELWLKKTGQKAEEKTSSSQGYLFKAGHLLEPVVAQLFLEQLKINEPKIKAELIPDTTMYQAGRTYPDGSLRWPFLFINLDYRLKINGKHNGILECKTITPNNREKIALVKAGICPPDYECQVRAYMAGANLDFAYIAFMWGSSVNDFAYIFIPRDYDKEEYIMQKAEYFYKCVEDMVEPDLLTCSYPELVAEYEAARALLVDDSKFVEISEEYGDIIQEAFDIDEAADELGRKKAELDARRDEIHNLFYPLLGDAGSGKVNLPNGKVGVITQTMHYTKALFDENKFKSENPELYNDYLKAVFDEKTFKKDYPIEYAKYVIAAQPKENEPRSFTLKYERETEIPDIDGGTKIEFIKRKGSKDEDTKSVKAALKAIKSA